MLRILSLLFTLLALYLAPAQSAIAQATNAAQPKLSLKPCRLPGWNEDVRCGKYEVFENRPAKSGRRLSLRVVVVPALGAKAAPDPIFYFSGGPGGSAVE